MRDTKNHLVKGLPRGIINGALTGSSRRASPAERFAWAAANADNAAGRLHTLPLPEGPTVWATETFVSQLKASGTSRRLVLAAAYALSQNPRHPHPVLAAQKLLRSPFGALTMGGHHQFFLTWRVAGPGERAVLLTVEQADRRETSSAPGTDAMPQPAIP